MCIVDGCDNIVLARGWCRKHYLRWYKHGDPTIKKEHIDYIPKGKNSPNFKHGQWRHPLYKTWVNMMDRCYNPDCVAYENYGGRGIKVCDDWHDINKFISDMGDRPNGFSLDRIDNDLGYSLSNCRWASYTTQSRNRRFTKLTPDLADQIRTLRNIGFQLKVLAKQYQVSLATVKKVVYGQYWKTQ